MRFFKRNAVIWRHAEIGVSLLHSAQGTEITYRFDGFQTFGDNFCMIRELNLNLWLIIRYWLTTFFTK